MDSPSGRPVHRRRIGKVTKLSASNFDLVTLHADLDHIDAKRHTASAG